MYAEANNPFERNFRDIPLLRFLIHSESLASEVLLPDKEAYRLVRLNNFKEIEVIPLPIADSKVNDCYLSNGLILTKYSRHGEPGWKAWHGWPRGQDGLVKSLYRLYQPRCGHHVMATEYEKSVDALRLCPLIRPGLWRPLVTVAGDGRLFLWNGGIN